MTITVSQPGVYISEASTPSGSVVSGSTSIPVFIGKFRYKNGVPLTTALISNPATDQKCYLVKNWLDFNKRFGESAETQVIFTEPSDVAVFDKFLKNERYYSSDSSMKNGWTTTDLYDNATEGYSNSDITIGNEGTQLRVSGRRESDLGRPNDSELGNKTWFSFTITPSKLLDFTECQAELTTYITGDYDNTEAYFNLYFSMTGNDGSYTSLGRKRGATTLDEAFSINFDLTSIGVINSDVYFILDIDTFDGPYNGAIEQREVRFSNFKIQAKLLSVEHTPHLGSSCLQHYFDNGGGPCYILPYTNIGDDSIAWADTIKRYPDISLISFCENEDHDTAYSAVNSLLDTSSGNLGYFLLADMPSDDFSPNTHPTQTAMYWPSLETRYSPRPSDDYIYVTGVVADGVEPSLDLLSNPNIPSELYELISTNVSLNIEDSKVLPPSPAMAGIYAKTDRERGVWKAPANIAINGVKSLYYNVGGYPSADYPTKPDSLGSTVNEIAQQTNRGLMVWGARTMDNTDLWRYIPVRRLFNAAERDIKTAMQSAVFQPNNNVNWEYVRASVVNYLDTLWRQGALMGEKAEEAYFVQVGKDVTMSAADIDAGRLIVKVGMAAVRPAEFIILQLTQDMQVS